MTNAKDCVKFDTPRAPAMCTRCARARCQYIVNARDQMHARRRGAFSCIAFRRCKRACKYRITAYCVFYVRERDYIIKKGVRMNPLIRLDNTSLWESVCVRPSVRPFFRSFIHPCRVRTAEIRGVMPTETLRRAPSASRIWWLRIRLCFIKLIFFKGVSVGRKKCFKFLVCKLRIWMHSDIERGNFDSFRKGLTDVRTF